MRLLKFLTAALAVSFTAGCSGGPNTDAPPPPTKTVFDPLTQQLGKARAVQGAADAHADATRNAVASQERGDSAP